MDLTLNFVGVAIADFARSLRFYTETLGIGVRDVKEDWAALETAGLVWELFGEGFPPPADRAWGRRQWPGGADLPGAITALRARGVAFAGDVERSRWGDRIELVAPEGIRWALVQAETPASSPRHPHLRWVEMKAHDVAGQRAFYADVLGLRPEDAGDGRVVFRQRAGDPLLFLEGGGQPAPVWRGARAEGTPVRLSIETADIGRAAAWLQARGTRILVDVTERGWGGIDTIVADADGNPIQVVQYVSG